MKNKFSIILIAIVTLLISVACVLNIGGPEYPKSPIPISTEELINLEEQIQQAVIDGAVNGQITLFISEAQISSLLAEKLSSQTDPLFTEPQVYLENGEIQLFGTTTQGYFKATVAIVLSANIDSDGKLILELTSADFGPFEAPDDLKDLITSFVTEAYTGTLGPVATGFKLEGIVISDGMMMIIGKLR